MKSDDYGAIGARWRDKRMTFGLAARLAAALLSCALLAAAFPPHGQAETAWVALVPLLILARFERPFGAFKWGFVSGLCFWLVSIRWLLRLAVTGAPWPLAVLGWVLLSGYCALYTGLFAMAVSLLFRMPARVDRGMAGASWIRSVVLTFLIPMLWVGFEYLRSVLFTGFPWNALGISQYGNLGLIQAAEWGGVYAVSALVMMLNTALALTGLDIWDVCMKRRKSRLHMEMMAALLTILLCWTHGLSTARSISAGSSGPIVKIALVQPNIPQLKKWPAEFESEIYDRLRQYSGLALVSRPDLLVWPETALPGPVPFDEAATDFARDTAARGVPLLAGALEIGSGAGGGGDVLYNSSFLFDDRGEIAGRYRKRHLVPFGEYLPFDRSIGLIKKLAPLGFSCAPGVESTVFGLALRDGADSRSARGAERVRFSVLICFEDIMAYLAREAVLGGARLLINQTNDAWFDGSAAAAQHMSHCVFRCVENRVPALRCANTGVSCFINAAGQIDRETLDQLSRGDAGLTVYRVGGAQLPGADFSPTVYTLYGDLVLGLPCGAFAAALALLGALRERRVRKRP